MTKFNNETLNPGEHFFYNNRIEFICLDIIDGNYLAIAAKPWKKLPFDTDGKNDWRNSSLRRDLNIGCIERHLVKQTSDLIADNGDRAYDTCEDYVTILSCDQYRKYRDIVPLFEECMWTLTPKSCDAGYSNLVRYVSPSGDISNYSAHGSLGVVPVCVFSSKNLKLRRQAQLVEVDE